DPYLHRAIAGRGNGDYDAALADCARALELNPNQPRAYAERVRVKLAQAAAQADSDRIELAKVFAKDDPFGLTADLERAVTLGALAGDDSAVLLRGAVRLMQGRDQEARQDFDRWGKRRPKAGPDLDAAVAKWRAERPALDLAPLDELVKVRPRRG